jgi:hypothetical protein
MAAQTHAYGIVAHDLDRSRADKVSELGAGFVRISIRWWQIEPSPGQFDWGALDDHVFNQAASRGLRIFATLEGPPEWAGGGPLRNQPPDLQAWYRFVNVVVRRYRTHIKHWGLWNEPDLTEFLTDRRAYRDIAFWGRQAVKDADPAGLTVGPEVSEGALDDGWFAEIMDSFGREYFDVVSVHIYDTDVASRMDRQVLPELEGKEVWLTETGRRAYAGNNIYEQLQRVYFALVLNAFEARRAWWTRVFFYDLWSWDRGFRFGICGPDWRNTLAFDYYRAWIAAHPAACEYSIGQTSQAFGAAGGEAGLDVAAGDACAWTATSNDSWISIVSGSSSSGTGVVRYRVAANTGTASRTGSLTVAGRTVVVTQAAGTGAAPGAPLDLAAGVSGTTVRLTWRAGPGSPPSSYTIEVAAASGATPYFVYRTGNPATEIVAVAAPAVYFVRIRGTNGSGASPPSAEIRVTIR